MQHDPVIWDGHALGPGPVALVILPGEGGARATAGALGAASSDQHSVLLVPELFQTFLAAHVSAVVVCHDAARLHWWLHDYFRGRGDEAAVQNLWALSRESRLVDVMLLDQQTRQVRGEDCTFGRTLRDLAKSLLEVELPEDEQVQEQVAAALPAPFRPENAPALSLALQVATVTRRVFERLASRAEEVMKAAEIASQPPSFQHRPRPPEEEVRRAESREKIRAFVDHCVRAQKERAGAAPPPATTGGDGTLEVEGDDRPARHAFGVLGIGLEVQGAIAARGLERRTLHLAEPRQGRGQRVAAEETFARTSDRLYQDRSIRGYFQWEPEERGGNKPRLVKRDPGTGEVKTAGEPFRTWLRDIPDELRDIHHCPALIPFPAENEPAEDPERWGVWADCHPILRAWRYLVRAAQVAALPANAKAVRPRYEVIPRLRAVSPSFSALRALTGLAGPVFQPQDGHVFVVGALEDLKIRCLMVLCQRSGYAFHGSLQCRYFAGRVAEAGRYSPVELAAADFFALATGPDIDAARAWVRTLECQETSEQQHARLAYEAAYKRFCEEAQLPSDRSDAVRPGPNLGPAAREQLPGPNNPGKTTHPVSGSTAPHDHRFRAQSGLAAYWQRTNIRRSRPSPARQTLEEAERAYDEARDTLELREAEETLGRALEAVEAARQSFLRLREEDPEKYKCWLRRTRTLIEALPLGLETGRLRELLTDTVPEWADVGANELEHYARILTERVATELAGFLDLDQFNKLAEQLREPTADVIEALAESVPLSHLTQSVLHHLMHFCKSGPVWEIVRRSSVAQPGSGEKRLSDQDIAALLLWWMALTPAGRVIGPGLFAETRREQYLAAADEVRKAVAYALVAEGFPLVAVTEDHFVLEMRQEEFTEEYERRLSDVVIAAQQKLLGRLAAPSHWVQVYAW